MEQLTVNDLEEIYLREGCLDLGNYKRFIEYIQNLITENLFEYTESMIKQIYYIIERESIEKTKDYYLQFYHRYQDRIKQHPRLINFLLQRIEDEIEHLTNPLYRYFTKHDNRFMQVFIIRSFTQLPEEIYALANYLSLDYLQERLLYDFQDQNHLRNHKSSPLNKLSSILRDKTDINIMSTFTLFRMTLLISPIHFHLHKIENILLHEVNMHIQKSRTPDETIEILNQRLLKIYQVSTQYHEAHCDKYFATPYASLLPIAACHMEILISSSLLEKHNMADNNLFQSAQHLINYLKERHELNHKKPTRTNYAKARQPLTIPFTLTKGIRKSQIVFLYDQLIEQQWIDLEINDFIKLFTKKNISEPIIWYGYRRDLRSLIVELKKHKIINTERKTFWFKISRIFVSPQAKYFDAKSLAKSKLSQKNDVISHWCSEIMR